MMIKTGKGMPKSHSKTSGTRPLSDLFSFFIELFLVLVGAFNGGHGRACSFGELGFRGGFLA